MELNNQKIDSNNIYGFLTTQKMFFCYLLFPKKPGCIFLFAEPIVSIQKSSFSRY
jgi:hypothetical protein